MTRNKLSVAASNPHLTTVWKQLKAISKNELLLLLVFNLLNKLYFYNFGELC